MTSSDIVRWGGIAAMLGGVPWVLWNNTFRVSNQAAFGPFSDALLLLAALLTLVGLLGLHALQGGSYERMWRAVGPTIAVKRTVATVSTD
jgi:hypothetical protein